MALSYSKSCLIGALMESMAYGLYFVLFLEALRVLRRRLVDGRLSLYLATTHIILFVLITIRMVLDNIVAIQAFADDPLTPNAAEIRYTSFDGALFRTGTYIGLTIVADIFIVYRVFAVWNNGYLAAAVPVALAIADIVAGGLFLDGISKLIAGASPNSNLLEQRSLIFYSFTMALNVLSTILISTRVWTLQRKVTNAAEGLSGSFMNVNTSLVILVESAALYSAALTATIASTALASNVQYCLLSSLPGTIGISFSLIITRVGAGISSETNTAVSSLKFGRARCRGATINSTMGGTTTHDMTDYSTASRDSSNGARASSGEEEKGVRVHLSPHSKDQTASRATTRFTNTTTDVIDVERQ